MLDSAADICAAVQQVLSEHVSEPLPFEYLKSFVGFHLDEVFTDVLPEATREQLDDLISRYKSTYLARKHTSTRLYPGVVEALAKSRRAQGYGNHEGHADHTRGTRPVRHSALL